MTFFFLNSGRKQGIYYVFLIFYFKGKCQKSNRLLQKKLLISVILNCVHTSKMGLLLHMILHIMPLFIGLAGLHRFMSSLTSSYSVVLMKTEWLQGNFMVADKIYHFFFVCVWKWNDVWQLVRDKMRCLLKWPRQRYTAW